MPKIDPAKLARFRALFALQRLSPAMQNDVLSEGAIAKRVKLSLSHPVKLAGAATVDRPRLFELFQKAADEQALPAEIEDIAGAKHPMQVAIDGDAAIVTIAENAIRFPLAALLTSNTQKRMALGADCISRHTLTAESRRAFEAIVGKEDFGDDDFFAANLILGASPESFAADLHQKAQTGQLSTADFLPTRDGYWNNLSAARAQSTTLRDFIANELATEREALIVRDPRAALEIVSLSFAAPELVPAELLKKLDSGTTLDAIRRLTEAGDPFALAGAFDLCAGRLAEAPGFAEAGEAILDKCFADPVRLCRNFESYGAAFVIATAHLAEHQVLRRQPVYWRRLAASAHAALVMRTLGEASEEGTSLLNWAMQRAGRSYYLSVVNDAHVEPRWRPDWIEARYLAADVYGRLAAAKARLSADAVPQGWNEKLAKAEAWIVAERVVLATTYPAILQGAAPVSGEKPIPGTPVADLYDTLIREPTAENLLMLTPVVWAFDFRPEAREAVLAVVQSLRSQTGQDDPDATERALGLAACIAALTRDNDLGELVSQICVERAAALQRDDVLLATVTIMLECAAANPNHEQAISTLARRLENLGFVSPPSVLNELLQLLGTLREINEPLGKLLGRAIATARLGRAIVASS
jgi:hypothetical protein